LREPHLDNRVLSFVNGVEYLASLFDDRLENRAFVKQVFQHRRIDELLQVGDGYDIIIRRTTALPPPGFGDALRYRFNDWLYAKASYEWATRLPTPEELLGDGRLVLPSPDLNPERRHSVNLGVGALARAPSGEISGFYRGLGDLIMQLPLDDGTRISHNVHSARSVGIEASTAWTIPGQWLALDVNATYQDYRNTSETGRFAAFADERIPNSPWLFVNAALRLSKREAFTSNDEIALSGYLRYVHEYFLGWENIGLPVSKELIPSYLLPSAGLVYSLRRQERGRLTSSVEVQNISDVRVIDVFGIQRPGRAFYAKVTFDY
jgi:outer membrane receptor protein involved in Fe transport